MRTDCGTVLLVAPTPRGWGETAFAVHLGKDLIASGWKVHSLTCDSTASLFHGSGIAVTTVCDSTIPLLGLMIDALDDAVRPAAIVLCDIVASIRALKRAGVGPDSLFRRKTPITGVDTWNSAVAGPVMDMFGSEGLDAQAWLDKIPRRLLPVPFLNEDSGPGVCRFVPQGRALSVRVRRHLRRELGISDTEKLVLFCTSPWQHGPYRNPDGQRLAVAVPRLISQYLSELGPAVHLVHVGPSRYDGLSLSGDRYHWIQPQRADIFESLLAGADMLLSLNISAVTTIRAVALGVPVVVLGNSCRARTADGINDFMGGAWHPIVEKNAPLLSPLYAFTLWPLGLKSYLQPTLAGNPFLKALRPLELLDGARVIETIHELLFSPRAAADMRGMQEAYKRRLQGLPTPAAALQGVLRDLIGNERTYEAA